ncbi:sigma-70 family RNA polymerase sigma factor [Methylocella sp.]|uniref:sigma-70 family RNA polymerase sigma factor n=1 Tax=Methylocella sp. TaxID=1978226 RepID=UPI0037843BE5
MTAFAPQAPARAGWPRPAAAAPKSLPRPLAAGVSAFAEGVLALAHIVGLTREKPETAPTAADVERFRRQVLPHLDAAYTLARYLARDADAAQDITQDAMLRALRGFMTFRGEAARPWLFAIVRNCHLDWRARRGRGGGESQPGDFEVEAVADESDDPEVALLRDGVARGVRRTLMRLPEAFREVLVLREMEDLSYREIAEVVGAPVGTVMSRLSRARQLFGELWRRDDPEGQTP